MKYMITWTERPQGSALEYERAQQRILDVFRKWGTRCAASSKSWHGATA